MNFCVLVKISKRSVSFWYQTDKSPYAPLIIKDSNEVPLYFYVNGNDFIFGNIARDRFYQNDPNAYGQYFEIIKDPARHFTIYGNKKPVKQLLYHGIEQHLSFFINAVLYKGDSIESYRQHFPLKFLFDVDIEEKEKTLIHSLFTDAGYFNISSVNYDAALLTVLVQNKFISEQNNVLLLNGLNDTLYIKSYENFSSPPLSILNIEGQGADPRVKMLSEMIIEYIFTQNSFLSFNKEIETGNLLFFCANLLNNLTPIIKGEAELTDGKKYWFKVTERSLNDRLQFYSRDQEIYTSIDDLLNTHKFKPDNTIIVLVGEEISTSYFLNKLLKKYPKVKQVDAVYLKDTMELLFTMTISEKPKRIAVVVPPTKPQLPPVPKPAIPNKGKPVLPPPLPPKKNN
jgi:hypothetical protein